MARTRRSLAALAVVVLVTGLTGCGAQDKTPSQSPAQALARAKKLFDDASSVHLSLATGSRPTSGNAVLSADGVGTHQPAFKGSVKVIISGLTANVPVVSLGGKVHAKLPLTIGYHVIDPEEYDAPDPADFMDPDQGISALLTQLDKPRRTGRARSGSVIVTSYAGSLAGAAVQKIIPSARASSSYATTVNIDRAGRATSVHVTGPFFAGSDNVTYVLDLSDYGRDVKISAP